MYVREIVLKTSIFKLLYFLQLKSCNQYAGQIMDYISDNHSDCLYNGQDYWIASVHETWIHIVLKKMNKSLFLKILFKFYNPPLQILYFEDDVKCRINFGQP